MGSGRLVSQSPPEVTPHLWLQVEQQCRVDLGRGYNFKVTYSVPSLFREVVERVSDEVPPETGLIAADEGVGPLVGSVALLRGVPFWIVRSRRHHKRVSMGTNPVLDHPSISGGSRTHNASYLLIDDIMGSGGKLIRALSLLQERGFDARSALVVFAYGHEREEATKALSEVGCKVRVLHVLGEDGHCPR